MPLPLPLPPFTCDIHAAESRMRQGRFEDERVTPEAPRFVVSRVAQLRRGPSMDAPVLQQLGYGVKLAVVAQHCAEGWTLVISPYGTIEFAVGFVRDENLAPNVLDEATVTANVRSAATPVDTAAWAMVEAAYFPSPAHAAEATRAQIAASASLTDVTTAPCDLHFGSCAVLDMGLNNLDKLPVPPSIAGIETAMRRRCGRARTAAGAAPRNGRGEPGPAPSPTRPSRPGEGSRAEVFSAAVNNPPPRGYPRSRTVNDPPASLLHPAFPALFARL